MEKYMAYPFEALGAFLRRLSLSSSAGNAVSWGIFFFIAALPLAVGAVLLFRKRISWEDGLLPILSLLLLINMWFYINPTYVKAYYPVSLAGNEPGAAMCSAVYCAALAWLVLHFLRGYDSMNRKKFLRAFQALLGTLAALLSAAVLLQGTTELCGNLRLLHQNIGINRDNYMFYLFVFLQVLAECLPKIYIVKLLVSVVGFLIDCEEDPFNEDSSLWVDHLKTSCLTFLPRILLWNLAVNGLEVLLGSMMRLGEYMATFPFWEALFVLGVLLCCRIYQESRKKEMICDSFI